MVMLEMIWMMMTEQHLTIYKHQHLKQIPFMAANGLLFFFFANGLLKIQLALAAAHCAVHNGLRNEN